MQQGGQYDGLISIHALLAESDHWYHISKKAAIGFLSTLSLRRATITCCLHMRHVVFLSTLSLRRATTQSQIDARVIPISIHALLAESDGIPNQVGTWEVISIHALLAESDLAYCTKF